MKYTQLFTLELLHNYYADQRCGDFLISPKPATQKQLTDTRCVLKPFANGIRVLMPVDSAGLPFIAPPAGARFAFSLRLQNPDFRLFTDLSAFDALAAPCYRNNGSTPQLEPVSTQATFTENFTVKSPTASDPFTLSGNPLRGVALSAFQVKGQGLAVKPVAFDETAKILRVNSAKAKALATFTVSYPIQPQLPLGVFADVEIDLAGGGSSFQIVFQAKKARWQYYIVTNPSNTPVIEDKDKAITFTAQPVDASDKIANELAAQYPAMQTFRMASNDLIACQQAARKHIQLQVNGEKVLDALPNPPMQNFAQDSHLYQIVKYFTR